MKCKTCEGSGKVVLAIERGSWEWNYLPYGATRPKTCPSCNGSGKNE